MADLPKDDKTPEELEAEKALGTLKEQAEKLGLKLLGQNSIDKIVGDAFKRGAKNSAEAKELDELRKKAEGAEAVAKELAELKAKQEGGKGKDTDADADAMTERIAQLTKEFDERVEALETKNTELEETGKKQALAHRDEELKTAVITAAGKLDAIDPEDVFTLMQARGLFDYDEENKAWLLLNPKGQVRVDADEGGENMTLDKGVSEFMDQRTNLKRASGRRGSGQEKDNGTREREDVAPPEGLQGELKPSEIFAKRHEVLAHLSSGGQGVRVAGGQSSSAK